jgi:ABC-type nickel/cobalt efflux system permease component RcnA
MEIHNLDAMFVFTVTIGFTAFLMAWVIMVVAVKGWAVRREHKQSFKLF